MHINKALMESSGITRHFMTDRERKVKKALCKLLISKGHSKYAERFWKFDFNIIDSKKHPDFTAAISFDEATVFISDGFLGENEAIFNQLDVLLRHELAHNLMMHQIRMMHVFKRLHADNPDEAYEHIKYSSSLHTLLNYLEDFEISNKRYSDADKKIVRAMQLNGRVIGGLITEEHRSSWANMSLEAMYKELSDELIKINSEIRSDPSWAPTKDGQQSSEIDSLKAYGAQAISLYSNITKPSSIKAPIDIFIKSQNFKSWGKLYQKIVTDIFNELGPILTQAEIDGTVDTVKKAILDLIRQVANTGPQEKFVLINPIYGNVITTLYTPEDKCLANDVLKNLSGNINYDPLKFKIKKKTNSQEYKDAWNKVIQTLDKKKFDDTILSQVLDVINQQA